MKFDIEARQAKRAQNSRRRIRMIIYCSFLLLFLITIYAIYIGFTQGWPDWTGFNEQIPPPNVGDAYEHRKTLWDWFQLLIVPIVLSVAAFFFNETQRRNAERTAEQQAKVDREIENQRSQDNILEDFIDRMSELLTEKDLKISKLDSEVRIVARLRTLTTMRRLDSRRNQVLTQFLQDAELIGKYNLNHEDIISFSEANLENIKLERANLKGVNLQGANLWKADLYLANLQKANLQGAYLAGATLASANIQEANLQDVDMVSANLVMAHLEKANLQDAILSGAYLSSAWLRDANLQNTKLHSASLDSALLEGANLQNADLSKGVEIKEKETKNNIRWDFTPGKGTNLRNASLEGANLRGANLKDADLQHANLTGADLTNAILDNSSIKKAYVRK